MPKASLNPDKAKQGGGGVEAGNYEVLAAKFMNLKSDFRATALNLVLECATLDKAGDRVRGADPVEIDFGFGPKSLEMFTPGSASGPEDASPVSQGTEPDAEGPTIYCEDGAQFNKSCGAMVFQETLVKAGFPKSVLDQCWAPAFVGLKFELATLPPKEVNDAFGTRLNTKPMLDEKTGAPAAITYKICRKWLNPAYLGTNGTGTAKGAGEAAAGTAAAPEAADPETNTKTILSIIAAKRPGKKGQVKSLQQLSGLLTQQYTTLKMPPKEMAKCQGYVKDKDWLNAAFLDLGIMDADGNPTVVSDDGSIAFPDAA